ESKFWFPSYKHLYRSLENAFALFQQVGILKFDHDSPEKAVKSYADNEYKIDYFYRKFYEHFHQARKQNIIKLLIEQVEKVYVNDWLFTQGNAYQKLLNTKTNWQFNKFRMQRDFFKQKVHPILEKQKIVVVISDALRYECGVELAGEINKISKFQANLE